MSEKTAYQQLQPEERLTIASLHLMIARFVHPGTRSRLGCRFSADNMQRQG
ncbi:hypothetical protein BSU04_17730 [Caballeronia sordidicola]|jgi:hypothetical protein|uniref:Uncharacterized protein n=1 Tax=Caballeronia sordidicola TaxID=196367 RepID=A0A226X1N6_CABSO|nr:hypothetical protein BSU04_17730 [Caballeronia sordidicola]